jgi:Holliday junction resolvasome RuvABC endonuclease subunit
MIVAGLDVSLAGSGVAVYDTALREWKLSLVKAPAQGDSLRMMRYRIRLAIDGVLDLLPAHGLVLIALEKPLPARSGFASLQLERAAVYWQLVDQLLPKCELIDIHPKVRAKLATGNGNASKPEVLKRVRADFPDLTVRDHNAADAVALCAAAAAAVGAPLMTYDAKQQAAYDSVSWPEIGR